MKRLNFIFILVYFCSLSASGQLTIEYCQQKAKDNFPLIKQYNLIEAAGKYNLENASKVYLPQVTLGSQATYQSQVVELPIKIPGVNIPPIEKDQYRATVDVAQLIWDGGNSKAVRKIVKAATEIETKANDVSVYAITDKVNQIYFGLLSIDVQIKQADLLLNTLASNKQIVASAVKNGIALPAEEALIQVEILQVEQAKESLEIAHKAYVNMMAVIIGEEIKTDTKFETPQPILPSAQLSRPELDMFSRQRAFYNAKESTLNAKNMPTLAAFVQGGYGKPGLNMMSNEFSPYAIGGLKFSWNFSSLYTKKNEKKLLRNNIHQVDVQEEIFRYNTNLQMEQQKGEIDKIGKLIEKDIEIIRLRTEIRQASESKYKNGIYTTTDLVKDINAESKAMQDKALHEVQYIFTTYNQSYINGKQ